MAKSNFTFKLDDTVKEQLLIVCKEHEISMAELFHSLADEVASKKLIPNVPPKRRITFNRN